MKQKITNTPEETKKFAQNFVRNLKGGEILGLVGDLGAGKTVFVQGLAKALGVKEVVNSPTFVLMKIYEISLTKGARPSTPNIIQRLVHIDAYRLESFEQLKEIGIEEYLNQKDCVVAIEWADKVSEIKQYPKYQEIIFKEGKSLEERVICIQ